jgi:hypothetical protein
MVRMTRRSPDRGLLLQSVVSAFAILIAGAAVAVAQTLPAAPEQLEAQIYGSQVRLTWNAGGDPVALMRIEAGSAPGATDVAILHVAGSALQFITPAPRGTYYVRVRGVTSSGTGPASNEVIVAVGECQAPPPPPSAISAVVTGTRATLGWTAPSSATGVVLEAGTSPFASDVFVGDVGAVSSIAADVAPGTYFARVRGRNACGRSAPSPEVRLVVGTGPEPASLVAGVVGRDVTLAWDPPGGGADGFLIDVGSAPGLTDIATIPAPGMTPTLTAVGVPPGVYHVRVRARRGATASGPSNEVVVTVSDVGGTAVRLVGFGLISATAPLVTYEEGGVTVTPVTGGWEARTNYGEPPPYVGFTRAGSRDQSASLAVTWVRGAFRASALSVYSSVTTIPVVLTGMLGPHIVYSATTTVPNTFGRFAGVLNPFAGVVIDRLLVSMSNDYSGNPMGIDNLAIGYSGPP